MSDSSPATLTDVWLYSPGELNRHAGQLAGELNRRVVVLAGEFGRHASRLARRARPDPVLSDLLRLPYLPYSCDI
ncbi:hypothetical protein F2Q70_00043414 [Brassica cretica]|uniref:Uncharacterized protein n=1 Tax=Brassica cretica TaxID=69181 RepID=A0A8S9KKH8_BRACR|nr:hypothetical protein F2Q70_00043414 [Brassica cretica]KAF3517319.1 hypothetical protein DY000_02060506 [Brassica cretica]